MCDRERESQACCCSHPCAHTRIVTSTEARYFPVPRLVQRDEVGRVVGTDTWASVSDGLVRDRKFTKVATDHLGFDLYDIEMFAVVNGDDGTDHCGKDHHVAQVGLHGLRLLVRSLGSSGSLGLLSLSPLGWP